MFFRKKRACPVDSSPVYPVILRRLVQSKSDHVAMGFPAHFYRAGSLEIGGVVVSVTKAGSYDVSVQNDGYTITLLCGYLDAYSPTVITFPTPLVLPIREPTFDLFLWASVETEMNLLIYPSGNRGRE